MKFDLTAPCGNCPFRTDITFYLRAERVDEICEALVVDQRTFSCHKTTEHGCRDGDGHVGPKEQHCAGALIMLEKMDRPNQMMRIMERLGGYDRTKLAMAAPVFDSGSDMIDHYLKQNERIR